MFNLVALSLVVSPIFVSSQLRIGGGRSAHEGAVPYQVVLRIGEAGLCSGSIIAPQAILTAAHCVYGKYPSHLTVTVGTNHLFSGGKSHDIRKVVPHEEYNKQNGMNDIAVIFTEDDIQFSDTVQPVELNDEPVPTGMPLLVSGWGSAYTEGQPQNDLKSLKVYAVSYKDCMAQAHGRTPVHETDICAVSGPGKGICYGDSGGPLVDLNEKLVGVASRVIKCVAGTPDIYTDVYSFRPWIEKTLHYDGYYQ